MDSCKRVEVDVFLNNARKMHNFLPGVRVHGMHIYIFIAGGPRQTAKLPWSRTGPGE